MITELKALQTICDELREKKRRIVFTNGCFDILHVGHVRYLASARAMGDCLVVGLNTDRSVKALKGPLRPVNSEQDRAEVLDALRFVDYVVLFGEATAENLIRAVKPAVYVKGGDYTLETLPEAAAVNACGGRIELVSLVRGKSSTNIINKIQSERNAGK